MPLEHRGDRAPSTPEVVLRIHLSECPTAPIAGTVDVMFDTVGNDLAGQPTAPRCVRPTISHEHGSAGPSMVDHDHLYAVLVWGLANLAEPIAESVRSRLYCIAFGAKG